jgi:hypothetical protein
MYEGKIVGFCAPDIPEQELGLLMAGASTGADADASSAGGGAGVAEELGEGAVPHQPTADEMLELPADHGEPLAEEPEK